MNMGITDTTKIGRAIRNSILPLAIDECIWTRFGHHLRHPDSL